MPLKAAWFRDKLRKKSTQGFQGFPMATVAYYGPNDARPTKGTVAIVMSEDSEPEFLERWFRSN